MKLNFRKIVSVLTSTVMLSSTLALAAAANYPAPFVKGGAADVAIVYGSTAANTDLVAVNDLNAHLQLQLARQTAPSSGSTSGATASGGDSINLATSNQKIYMNSSINAARTVLTNIELPTLLADGTATDLAGTQYKYTQKITPGYTKVLFSKSGESIDPVPILDVGSTANSPLFNYTLTLVKTLNVSDSTNVIGTSTLSMLGTEYTIGANSDSNTLYLYGSGERASVDEGETKTVTAGGVDHTVTLKGATSATAATIIVDGVQKSVTKGSSYKFAGDFEVYIKDVYYTTKTGTLSNVDILLGSQTLHFEDGQAIRYGADDTTIQGSIANISGTAGVGISALTVAQAAKEANGDYLKAGDSFVDRVLGGSAKLQFAGLNPSLDSASRDAIQIKTDNSVAAYVKFTTALAGDKGAYTLNYARDTDGLSDGTLPGVRSADSNNYTISVQEGDNLTLNMYAIVNSGDKGRILTLTAISPGTSTTDKTTFQDAITGESFDFTTGVLNATSRNIDGQTYYIATNPSNVNITWGPGSSAGTFGTQRTLFPRIKLKNGGWMSILVSTNVSNNTAYSLPGADSLTTYEGSTTQLTYGNASGNTTAFGKVGYYTSWATISGGIAGLNMTGTLSNLTLGGTVNCNFNSTLGPAILIQEEKTVTGSASTNGEVICIPLTREGSATILPAIDSPAFSDDTTLAGKSLSTDNSRSQAVTTFGTLVERDTDDANTVNIWLPDEQMIADLLFTDNKAVVDSGDGTTSSGSGVKELGKVTYSDTEAANLNMNLVVVGGSCVNSIAASLLGGAFCGPDFTAKTGVGSGQFLVKTFSRSDGKVATLVAGYNAADTTNAATYLRTQLSVNTDVDKTYVGTSSTDATLIVEPPVV